MVLNTVNEASIAAVARLSHAVRQLRHGGVIRQCGVVLLAVGLAGLAPRAVAPTLPLAPIWRFICRYVAPIAVGWILVSGL